MSGEDVLVSIGIDSSALDAGLAKSSAEIKAWGSSASKSMDSTAEHTKYVADAMAGMNARVAALKTRIEELKTKTTTSTAATVDLGKEINNLKNILRVANPAMGQTGEYAAGLARALSGSSGATLAIGGFGAALLIAAGAGYKFAEFVVDTIDNVDHLADSMSQMDRAALRGTIISMEEAAQAGKDLDASFAAMQVQIAGGFARDLRDMREALSGIVDEANALDRNTGGGFSSALEQGLIGELPTSLQFLIPIVEAYGDAIGRAKDQARDAANEQQRWVDQQLRTIDGPHEPGVVEDQAAKAKQIEEKQRQDRIASAKADAEQAKREAQQFAAAMQGFTGDVTSINGVSVGHTGVDEVMAEAQARQDLTAEIKKQRDAEVEAGRQSIIAQQAKIDALAEEKKFREDITAQTKAAAVAESNAALQMSQQWVGAATDLFAQIAEKGGASARDVWEIQHIAAIAQGALQIPLAILQGLGQGGAPTAAVYGALAIAQEAAIIATPPPKLHHVGGSLAPDEAPMGGWTGLAGEIQAVFSRQAVERMGGPAGVEQAARGTGPAGWSGDIYLVDADGMKRKARRFAAPTRGLGRQIGGLR